MSEDANGKSPTTGDDDSGAASVQEDISPAAAFELVADETRTRILLELRRAVSQDGSGSRVQFSELRDRVDVADSGRFNYHLDRLQDRFVRKTGQGYELSPAGWQLIGALLSGSVTSSLPDRTVAAEGSCVECDGRLEATLRDAGVTVECVDCGYVQTNPDVPPAIFEGWPDDEIPRVVGRYLRREEVDAALGFCSNCEGRVDRVVAAPGDEAAPEWFDGEGADAVLVTECRRCGDWWHAALPIAALAEPAVVCFHYEHDIDLRARPGWTLDHLDFGTATLRESPRRVHIQMELDGDARTFVFDGCFEFVEEQHG